jgi:hypothetical protein
MSASGHDRKSGASLKLVRYAPQSGSEVERKQSGEERTSLKECLKLGVFRTYIGHGPYFAS